MPYSWTSVDVCGSAVSEDLAHMTQQQVEASAHGHFPATTHIPRVSGVIGQWVGGR